MATSAELKQNILNGGYDQAFAKLYGADTATVAAQRVRYVDMIDHFETPDPSHTIITADRGYESYDLIAHLREKGLRFVLRAKDYTTPSSLLAFYKEEYPDSPEFDVTIKRFISNSKDREILDNPSIYKYVKPAKDLPHIKFGEESGLYYLQFRVVRIEIREGVYECLIVIDLLK